VHERFTGSKEHTDQMQRADGPAVCFAISIELSFHDTQQNIQKHCARTGHTMWRHLLRHTNPGHTMWRLLLRHTHTGHTMWRHLLRHTHRHTVHTNCRHLLRHTHTHRPHKNTANACLCLSYYFQNQQRQCECAASTGSLVIEKQCVSCEVGNDISMLFLCIPHQPSLFSSVTVIPPTPNSS
jgi:hypothetical protein